jgi:cytoskeletal protein RodZ
MSDRQSLGGAIRAARESSGFSISEIEKSTRIPAYILRDIELDKFESSGGTTYVRGHIRTIAKLFKIDSEPLLALFEGQTGEIDRPMIDLLAENNVTPARGNKRNVSYKTLGVAAGLVVVLAIALPAVLSFTKGHKVQSPATSEASPSAPSNNAVVATKGSGVVVLITGVTGKSWVGIQDSTGAQIFSGQIKVGSSQTFKDSQQLSVTIGNAGAVNLNVNGKDLGTPGNVGEVVHLSFGPNGSNQG